MKKLQLCYLHPSTNHRGAYAIFKETLDDSPLYLHSRETHNGVFYTFMISFYAPRDEIMVYRGRDVRVYSGKFHAGGRLIKRIRYNSQAEAHRAFYEAVAEPYAFLIEQFL